MCWQLMRKLEESKTFSSDAAIWFSLGSTTANKSMRPGSSWTVPPGFRFHPTDEELLSYYLRRKVASEPIVPDIIREVDPSKLQPWDLLDHCSVGMGSPDDYCYFFSHNHKGSRAAVNRGTTAGYWKPVGRDKAIFVCTGERIGLRKTWVFYTSTPRRASRGRKTDWTMHEYRLDDDDSNDILVPVQHDAWVVCKIFKKKGTRRGSQRPDTAAVADDLQSSYSLVGSTPLPVDVAGSSGVQPITGFLGSLLSPFKTIKTVQFNLNLAIFGPVGLHVDLDF
ncbi:unnamed protein product [Urochloa humidicola]